MKKTFIVANWKSNMTSSEAKSWVEQLDIQSLDLSGKEVVICPPLTLLSDLKLHFVNNKLNVDLGAQNISPFEEGAYTGEVSAKQVKEFVQYVIVGHSERRKNFGETDEILFKQFNLARENGLKVIYCVQGKETRIPDGSDLVAYEPINAIGTGNPDSPENAEEIAAYFKANFKVSTVLYGGSVTADNVGSFTKMPNIDGVLVGKASLDAREFYEIIKNA